MKTKDVQVFAFLLIFAIILSIIYCKFLIPNTLGTLRVMEVIDIVWVIWLALATVYGFVRAFIKE